MSTALAIAGVTAVLRDRLNDGLVNHNVAGLLGNTVTVSVRSPDRVMPADGAETSQLNLFLYQVTPNLGWRNEGLPSHDASGRHRLSNPPLALDLHYLISAYSGGELHAEILLGYAMQLMHEFPVITREMIRIALNPSPDVGATLPPALRALAECGLADQVEQLRITPQTLSSEESSKLWTATLSSCRPSAAYLVSVVLIEATRNTRPTLPVLSRGPVNPVTGRDRGVVVSTGMVPPLPAIEAVLPADKQPVAQLGALVSLMGHHLDGANREVRLVNPRFAIDETLAATGTVSADQLDFMIPLARAADFPVGVYEVSATLLRPQETVIRETNRLACIVAPGITNLPQTIVRDGTDTAQLTLDFTPQLRPGQRVSLLLGSREIAIATPAAPVASLNFTIADAEPGIHLARLRVDGIDSPLVDRAATPPQFLPVAVTVT